MTSHSAARRAGSWRCRIRASPGWWTSVITRADRRVMESHRVVRSSQPLDGRALSCYASGVEEPMGGLGHLLDDVLTMLLEQDDEVGIRERLSEVWHPLHRPTVGVPGLHVGVVEGDDR